jgi:hypothetical protein
MNIKKEAHTLRDLDYLSENEEEVVNNFAEVVSRDSNFNNIKTAYYAYYSVRRNSPAYNQDASNIIEKIYNRMKSKQL